ncbi:MAG: hypothetical protein P1V20_06565 [Verrucomicrobiales bacterium]|nr:hypothetical protein [Verrucomicrobiales bacterium]
MEGPGISLRNRGGVDVSQALLPVGWHDGSRIATGKSACYTFRMVLCCMQAV